MSDAIVAGRFDSFAKAETTAGRLRAQGVAEEDLSVFYVNPPGQHATYPIGGDIAATPRAPSRTWRSERRAGWRRCGRCARGGADHAAGGIAAGVVICADLHNRTRGLCRFAGRCR